MPLLDRLRLSALLEPERDLLVLLAGGDFAFFGEEREGEPRPAFLVGDFSFFLGEREGDGCNRGRRWRLHVLEH